MTTTKNRVRELIEAGYKVREIAQLCAVSTQRVYQLMREMDIDPPTRRDGVATTEQDEA